MSRRKLPVLTEQAIGAVRAEATSRAQSFERQIRKGANVSCRTGCSNCCYLPIEISILEAIPIYRELVQRGKWTPAFIQRLKEHAQTTTLLSPKVWMLAHIACPLLTEKKCSVYEVRPFHCRTMWATGDPFYCDGQNFGDETTIIPKGELVRDFLAYIEWAGKQAKIPNLTLPISKSLLIAEKAATGQIDLADVMFDVLKDV